MEEQGNVQLKTSDGAMGEKDSFTSSWTEVEGTTTALAGEREVENHAPTSLVVHYYDWMRKNWLWETGWMPDTMAPEATCSLRSPRSQNTLLIKFRMKMTHRSLLKRKIARCPKVVKRERSVHLISVGRLLDEERSGGRRAMSIRGSARECSLLHVRLGRMPIICLELGYWLYNCVQLGKIKCRLNKRKAELATGCQTVRVQTLPLQKCDGFSIWDIKVRKWWAYEKLSGECPAEEEIWTAQAQAHGRLCI